MCSETCAGLCKPGGSSEWNIGPGCPDSVFCLQSDFLRVERMLPPPVLQTEATQGCANFRHSPRHEWIEVATAAVSKIQIL